MTRRMRVCRTLVMVVVLAVQPLLANSSNFSISESLHLSATAGLDQRTLSFLSEFPVEIKNQLLDLLEKAKPLIDDSVELYLARVDEILNNQVLDLECAVIGSEGKLSDDIKSAVTFGEVKIEPTQQITNDWSTTKTSLKYSYPPGKIEQIYADFLFRATAKYCEARIEPSASHDIKDLEGEVRPRWWVWYRLTDQCSDASHCYDWLHNKVGNHISSADPRDCKEVDASNQFLKVSKPPVPGVIERHIQPLDAKPFEDAFTQLYLIEDGLRIAEVKREAAAAQLIDDATKLLDAEAKVIDQAKASLSDNSLSGDETAARWAGKVLSTSTQKLVNDNLDSAVGYSVKQQAAADTQRERLKRLKTERDEVAVAADQKIKIIWGRIAAGIAAGRH
jgi:hypothetical protein